MTSPSPLDRYKATTLGDFERRAALLLTSPERGFLYAALGQYETLGRVDALVPRVLSTLDTPAKLDLLKDVRQFVQASQRVQFDRLVPYQHMAHPWREADVNRMTKELGRSAVDLRSGVDPRSAADLRSGVDPRSAADLRSAVDLRSVGGTRRRSAVSKVGRLGRNTSSSTPNLTKVGVVDFYQESANLREGEEVVGVNGKSLDPLALTGALSEGGRHRVLVRGAAAPSRPPGLVEARERIAWYDVSKKAIVPIDSWAEGAPPASSPGRGTMRGVAITVNYEGQWLGFNVRGGSEFGLGIYVSMVDRGGLADKKCVRVGDELLSVNDQPCTGMTHAEAVRLLTTARLLRLMLRHAGRYPVFKETFEDFHFSDARLANPVTYPDSFLQDGGAAELRFNQMSPVVSRPNDRTLSPAAVRERSLTKHNSRHAVRFPDRDDRGFVRLRDTHVDDPHGTEHVRTEQSFRATQGRMDHVSKTSSLPNNERRDYNDSGVYSYPKYSIPRRVERAAKTRSGRMYNSRSADNLSDVGHSEDWNNAAISSTGATLQNDKTSRQERDRVMNSTEERGLRQINVDETENVRREMLERMRYLSDNGSARSDDDNSAPVGSDDIMYARSQSAKHRDVTYSEQDGSIDAEMYNPYDEAVTRTPVKGSDSYSSANKSTANIPLSSLDFGSFLRRKNLQTDSRPSPTKHAASAVESKARQLHMLSNDEVAAIVRHISRYARERPPDVDSLVTSLLSILDTPAKQQLLLDVRQVLRPADVPRFDLLTAKPPSSRSTTERGTSAAGSKEVATRIIRSGGHSGGGTAPAVGALNKALAASRRGRSGDNNARGKQDGGEGARQKDLEGFSLSSGGAARVELNDDPLLRPLAEDLILRRYPHPSSTSPSPGGQRSDSHAPYCDQHSSDESETARRRASNAFNDSSSSISSVVQTRHLTTRRGFDDLPSSTQPPRSFSPTTEYPTLGKTGQSSSRSFRENSNGILDTHDNISPSTSGYALSSKTGPLSRRNSASLPPVIKFRVNSPRRDSLTAKDFVEPVLLDGFFMGSSPEYGVGKSQHHGKKDLSRVSSSGSRDGTNTPKSSPTSKPPKGVKNLGAGVVKATTRKGRSVRDLEYVVNPPTQFLDAQQTRGGGGAGGTQGHSPLSVDEGEGEAFTSFLGASERAEFYPPYSLATHPLRALEAVLDEQGSLDDEQGALSRENDLVVSRSGSPVSLDSTYSITTTRYGSYDFDAPSHSRVTKGVAGLRGGSDPRGGTGGRLASRSLFELKQARRRREGSIDSGWSSSEQRGGTPVLSGFSLRGAGTPTLSGFALKGSATPTLLGFTLRGEASGDKIAPAKPSRKSAGQKTS